MTAERQRRGSWKTRENENIALEAAALSRQKEAQKKKRQHPRDPEDVVAEKRLREYNNSFIVSTEAESAVPKKYRRKEIFKAARPKNASHASQDAHHEALPQSVLIPHNSLAHDDLPPASVHQGQDSRRSVAPSSALAAEAEQHSDGNNEGEEGNGRSGGEHSDSGEDQPVVHKHDTIYGPPVPPSPHNQRDRSPTPTLSSESESGENLHTQRAPRGTVNSNSNRPKIADYPSSMQAVLNLAGGLFRTRLATEAPFATPNLEKRLSEETFASACETLGKEYEATEDQLLVIRKGACQMRSKLKELAETAVPLFHKFTRGALHAHKNRLQYRTLTTKDAYTHEDPENLVGIWFTPLLFTLVHGMWFKKDDDDGIKFSKYFRPEVRAQTIALVLTTIRCVLDEWKEGTYRRHDYKTNVYRHVYKSHLSGLRDLGSTPDGAKVLQSLGAELWESSSSQFSDGPGNKTPAFDPAANAHAMAHFLARAERKRIEMEENLASEVAY
ncbi:hypothetical protein BOTBODRAFT_61396 [Botryobasidium botryosum FD-172 SS1]|uniref:DUF6532 domain-containing protein n=1 Tax=Botryobasidium botryosum (strain FD-172 SS1) TaxID=930990 RepID=A0A067NCF2_BOTB1|nr:hypothetical protein BOTBODRAFT_61396 [Botryobasidium botryosum FD-172 SS1]